MPVELRVDPNISGQLEFGWIDGVIVALAERQHGVIARQQLIRAGVFPHVIDHKLALGRLHRLHRGVYAVGHCRLTREGHWMGAVLAAGEGAVLSHRAAAALLGLGHFLRIEVTAPTHRARPGIDVHTSIVPPDEVTAEQGIPVTTIPRTLVDLASVLPPHRVERAVNEAEVQRHTDHLSLADLVERYRGRRGIRTIKAILARLETGVTVTRSELESRFLAFTRQACLTSPLLNAHLLGFECDCVWPKQRVIVELDGHATHSTREAFEQDRARDRTLRAEGWQVVRVTWRQLHESPEALAADLRRILA
jgi:very-short-patch-repair endonuclease